MDYFIPHLTILFFALLTEASVKYIFGHMDGFRRYLSLISLFVAILLVFTFDLNILRLLLHLQTDAPFLDLIFSAFVIARLSNFIHGLF